MRLYEATKSTSGVSGMSLQEGNNIGVKVVQLRMGNIERKDHQEMGTKSLKSS